MNINRGEKEGKRLAGSCPVRNGWVNACPRYARRLRVAAGRVDPAAAGLGCSLSSPQLDAALFKTRNVSSIIRRYHFLNVPMLLARPPLQWANIQEPMSCRRCNTYREKATNDQDYL